MKEFKKKDLFEIPNPRLQRVHEKLVEYNMTVKWVPGKSHYIADPLSQAPLFDSCSPDEDKFTIDTARTCLTQLAEKNHELKLILDNLDADYSQFRKDVVEGTSNSVYSSQMRSVFVANLVLTKTWFSLMGTVLFCLMGPSKKFWLFYILPMLVLTGHMKWHGACIFGQECSTT